MYQTCSHLKASALAVPSIWNTIFPDIHVTHYLTIFRSLFTCHHLSVVFSDYPNLNLQPAYPCLSPLVCFLFLPTIYQIRTSNILYNLLINFVCCFLMLDYKLHESRDYFLFALFVVIFSVSRKMPGIY